MAVKPPTEPSVAEGAFRRFLTRAEVATLVGMILMVFSLFLTWKNTSIDTSILPAGSVLFKGNIAVNGFNMSLKWPIMICAILCSATLLWTPTEKTRIPLTFMQAVCGLVCFMLALTHFALLSGVLTGIVGGGLLTFGAIDRFTHSSKTE